MSASTQSESSNTNTWRRPEPGIPIIYYSMANSGRATLTVRSGCEIIFSQTTPVTTSSSPSKHACNVTSKIGHRHNTPNYYAPAPFGSYHSNDSGPLPPPPPPPITSPSIIGEYHPPRDIGDFAYSRSGNAMRGETWSEANSGEEVEMREQPVVPAMDGTNAQNKGLNNMLNNERLKEWIQQGTTGTSALNPVEEVDNYYDRIWKHDSHFVSDSSKYNNTGAHFFQTNIADVSNGRDQPGASNLCGPAAPGWNLLNEQHEWKNSQGSLMEVDGVQAAVHLQESQRLWDGKYEQWDNPEVDQWHPRQRDSREWYNLQMQHNTEELRCGSQNFTADSPHADLKDAVTMTHRSNNGTSGYNSPDGIDNNKTQHNMNLQINAALYRQNNNNYQYDMDSESNQINDPQILYQHDHYGNLQATQCSHKANAATINAANYSQENNQPHESSLLNLLSNAAQDIPDEPFQLYQL